MIPGSAYVLTDNPNATVIWLHNDGHNLQDSDGSSDENQGCQSFGHWEGFGPANDIHGPQRAERWGVDGPILQEAEQPYILVPRPETFDPYFDIDVDETTLVITYECKHCEKLFRSNMLVIVSMVSLS
jgi:hypothetical protein